MSRLWVMLYSTSGSTYKCMWNASSRSSITNINSNSSCSYCCNWNRLTSKWIRTRTWISMLSSVRVLITSKCERIISNDNTFSYTQCMSTNGDFHITSCRVIYYIRWIKTYIRTGSTNINSYSRSICRSDLHPLTSIRIIRTW